MQLFTNPDRIESDANRQIKVQKAKMKAYSQLKDIELERLEKDTAYTLEKLEKEAELQPQIDKIDQLKQNIRGMKNLQKQAWTYRLSAYALSIISALMTIAGIAGTDGLFAFKEAFTGKSAIFAIAAATLQLIVINLNKRSYELKKHHFVDYKGVSAFKAIVIAISMVGNFRYMNDIMPNNAFYTIVSLALAVALDFGSIWISTLATNVQYRNYTEATTEIGVKTRTEKFLYLLNEFCFGWIDEQYEEKINGKDPEETEESEKQQFDMCDSKESVCSIGAFDYSEAPGESLSDVARHLIA